MSAVTSLCAADFHPPAMQRYAQIAASGSILPGGRVIQPIGTQIETGPGTFNMAINRRGVVATTDIGYDRFGLTVMQQMKTGWDVKHIWARTPGGTWAETADPDWKGVSRGIAFENERVLWISEGDSGRVRQVDITSGLHQRFISLNDDEWHGSFTTDLALDPQRHLLYVLDQANARVAIVEAGKGKVLASVKVPATPSAIALAPDAKTAWVTCAGEANAVATINVADPRNPTVFTAPSGGEGPSAVLALADRIYISNAYSDSVTVLNAADRKPVAEIPLRIPGLENRRGIIPAGLAYDPLTRWLLVAEAGINAIAVIDTASNATIAHIPAGWYPVKVQIEGDRVYVANARGRGTGPNIRRPLLAIGELSMLHAASVSTFIMPAASELPKMTATVLAANGFVPDTRPQPPLPAAIHHVVLIVKEDRGFDEIFGDVSSAANGAVAANARFARFGNHGVADGRRARFSIQDVAITPNQHAIAQRWALGDNFYANGDAGSDGRFWLNGNYPDPLTQSNLFAAYGGQQAPGPATASALLQHLERNGVSSRFYDAAGAGDSALADRLIADADKPLPQFVYVRLPGDEANEKRIDAAHPYEASYVAENDFAVGRILEYLSHRPEWESTTVFITESNPHAGLDHIDTHRTPLLAAGPFVKRNYAEHTNSDFPGLLKTIFELLHLAPLNLMDAAAAGLNDIFTSEPDLTPFAVVAPDGRLLPSQ